MEFTSDNWKSKVMAYYLLPPPTSPPEIGPWVSIATKLQNSEIECILFSPLVSFLTKSIRQCRFVSFLFQELKPH